MAKVRPGGLMGQLSGKVGSVVFSHNRFGSYIRAWVKPVVSGTSFAQAQKGVFSAVSAAWRNLLPDQQKAWSEWAQVNQITDRVGQKQALDGHTAYVQINSRLLAAGNDMIDIPPVTPAPDPIVCSATYDIGAGNMELAPASALPADCDVALWAAVVDSHGINFAKNKMRLLSHLTITGTTPVSFQSVLQSRFGTLQVGQKVLLQYSIFDSTTGLYSGFLTDSGIITST